MKMGERSVSEQKWKQRERGMKEDRRLRWMVDLDEDSRVEDTMYR